MKKFLVPAQATVGGTDQTQGQASTTPDRVGVDFTQLAPGIAPSLSRYGFGFSRNSPATVQTGVSTVLSSGIDANVGRVGDNGTCKGFVLEETRANLVSYSRLLSSLPTAGSQVSYTSGRPSPDGSNNAQRIVVSSSGYANNENHGFVGPVVLSQWVAKGLGSGAYGAVNMDAALLGSGYTTNVYGTASVAWSRVATNPATLTGTGWCSPCDGRASTNGMTAGARDADIDFTQRELGRFATEVIATTGVASTRAGERLYLQDGSQVTTNGRASTELQFQPKGDRTAYTGSYVSILTHPNLTANLYVSSGLIAITGSNNRVQTTTTALSFSAGDTVKVWIDAGGNRTSKIQTQRTSGSMTGNMLPYSEPSSIGQLGANGAVTVSTTASWNGLDIGTNAVVFGNNSVGRYAYEPLSTSNGQSYNVSVYVKMDDGGAPVATDSNSGSDFLLVLDGSSQNNATVTQVSGSVYRVSKNITGIGTLGNCGVVKYTTNSSRSFTVTGYQARKAEWEADYIKTTGTAISSSVNVLKPAVSYALTGSGTGNYFLHSEDFSQAVWQKYHSAVSGNVLAPDNTYTAWKLTEEASTFAHGLMYNIPPGAWSFTFWVKAEERRYVQIGDGNAAAFGNLWFDLQSGSVAGNSSGLACSITSENNGYWKIKVPVSSAFTISVIANPLTSSAVGGGYGTSFPGTASYGVDVWKAQCTPQNWSTDYVKTTTSAITSEITSLLPISLTGSVDVLCNGTGSQLTSWVNKVWFHRNGSKPSWTV